MHTVVHTKTSINAMEGSQTRVAILAILHLPHDRANLMAYGVNCVVGKPSDLANLNIFFHYYVQITSSIIDISK